MGTKQVTGTSETDHIAAFQDVLSNFPPTTNTPRTYTVVEWRSEAGGVVHIPMFYVDVVIAGDDVTDD